MSDEETTNVALLPHSWGTGNTVSEAVKNATANFSNRGDEPEVPLAVYEVKGEFEISELGQIRAEEEINEKFNQAVKTETLELLDNLIQDIGFIAEQLGTDGEVNWDLLDEVTR